MSRERPPIRELWRRGTRGVLLLVALQTGALPVCGQQMGEPAPAPKPAGVAIDLRDGRQTFALRLRLQGDTLLATQSVGNGTGEVGYPLANIEKIEFPEPPPLATARNLLAQDKAAEALAQIDPIVAYYAAFKTVPGNWWVPAELVRYDALAQLKREREIDALLAELAALPNSPRSAEAARVRAAESLVRRGTPDRASASLDELIKTSTNEDVLARAWVAKGQIFLAGKEYEPALLACLHVPVFYPDDRQAMPPALLGSGKAFLGIDKPDDARATWQHLISSYPASPAAAEAKVELDRLDRRQRVAAAHS